MRVAVIGSGVAGLSAAADLHKHGIDTTVFEARDEVGGHVRTIDVDIGTRHIPVEMGVFMHDPKLIHPHMIEKVRELHVDTHTFPLTFAYSNKGLGVNWSLKGQEAGFQRDFPAFLEVSAKGLLKGHGLRDAKFMLQLKHFTELLPEICANPKYAELSIADFIKDEGFDTTFVETWLLPQLQCWWGAEREAAFASSTQVIADSFYRVSRAPQYIFNKGWQYFMEALAAPYQDKICLNAAVESVERGADGVTVQVNGESHAFDHVIFATPPNVVSQVLQSLSADERAVLDQFSTCSTEIFLHRDPSWMPSDRDDWAVVNLLQDERGSIATLWFGELFEEEPPVFVSWGEGLQEGPQDIIVEDRMLRTLPTVPYTQACHAINRLQGEGNVWHCGAHVHALGDDIPSLWHENAMLSGNHVAQRIIQCQKSS